MNLPPHIAAMLGQGAQQPAAADWWSYGQRPSQMARGGASAAKPARGALASDAGVVKGPGSGRDDKIESLLSDGEHVLTAEDVSLLGDGSNDEGHNRLEEMKVNLRKHKGGALTSGKISPDAKRPLEYLRKGR